MSKLHKLYYSFRYYGLRYVWLRISDKFFGHENATYFLYHRHKHINLREYEDELIKLYAVKTGKKLNLERSRTFNEKIQWMKLYDTIELKTTLADKYLVREWIKEKIGEQYLIPILGVWDRFEEIAWEDLPDSFVLKVNHGSGWNVVVKDKHAVDRAMIGKKMNNWLSLNFAFIGGFEMQYCNIVPKIIAEKYIEGANGNLYDYKVHCFYGKPKYIQVVGNRDFDTHYAKEAFYDVKWELQPFVTGMYSRYENLIAKPHNLDEMLKLAERLSEGFIYVRVDFYELSNGVIKFGEMTFTPGSGYLPWMPLGTDAILGENIKLLQKQN